MRELYLTLRAGLVVIVLVTVVFAVAAFVFTSVGGVTYRAIATVAVTPPAVGTSALNGLELSLPVGIDFEAYENLATDVNLIEAALEQVDPAIVTTSWTRAEIVGLLERFTVRSRTPVSQTRGHLLVEHSVTSGPGQAAVAEATAIANAWASATATAAARLMTEPVDAALTLLNTDLAGREAAFDRASAAWSDFVGIDERRSLNEKLDALTSLDSARRVRLADLDNAVAAAEARLTALRSSATTTSSDEVAAALLINQIDTLVGEHAGLVAERDHLATVLATTSDEAALLRAKLTTLEATASTLQRDLASASMDFYRIAPARTTLELQRELVASSARVTIPATEPVSPEARGRVRATVVAAVIGAVLATLFVFLRAAVRDPER